MKGNTQPGDLPLQQRSRAPFLGQSRPPVGPWTSRSVYSSRGSAEVDAVHPIELRVVERRRTSADAVGETLGSSAGDMIVVSPSGAQPSRREEVHQRLGQVARGASSSTDVAPWRFENFFVVAEHIRHMRVDRQLARGAARI